MAKYYQEKIGYGPQNNLQSFWTWKLQQWNRGSEWEKYSVSVVNISGAARMRPKRPCPPRNKLDPNFMVLYINFQLLENKRKEQSDW